MMAFPIARKQRGASVIEFGLVAFVFFLILWGIFEFARAFYVRNSYQQLTRCVAREAVVRLPSSFNDAKAACLLGGNHWPLLTNRATDVRDRIVVNYCRADGSCVTEPSGATYDNQAELCLSASPDCFANVRVEVAAGVAPESWGLLLRWLGRSGFFLEPRASTTMPAEAMGRCRDGTC